MKKKITTTLLFGGITILSIHLINKFIFSLSKIKDLSHKEENKYFDWRFGKIKYSKTGSGTPLILIHDLKLGSSSFEFNKIVSKLSKTNKVYTLDLLGYGLSEKPNITYTNYLYVQLLNDFIKKVVEKKSNIIVSGDSSSIAIMTAHNDPEIINKIIMLNPNSLCEYSKIPNAQTKILKHLLELPIIGTLIYNILGSKQQLKKKFNNEYFYDSTKVENNIIENYSETIHLPNYQSKFVFASYVGRYMNTNVTHALKEINHSISIIYSNEISNMKSIVEEYYNVNNAVESFSISKTKQLLHYEKPYIVTEQISIYLE